MVEEMEYLPINKIISMNGAKILSIIAAIATVGSALFLAATGHISWADASPMLVGGLSILGIHVNLPNTSAPSSSN